MNVCVRPTANAGMMMDPPRLRHAIHDLREQRSRISGRMLAISVGGFANQDVRMAGRRYRIVQDGLVVTPDVAGKHHHFLRSVFGDGQFQAGGAENVARIVRRDAELPDRC